MTNTTCTNGEHTQIVPDSFAKLVGVRRLLPGDCYCLACKQPVAANWNNGNPTPAERKTKRCTT